MALDGIKSKAQEFDLETFSRGRLYGLEQAAVIVEAEAQASMKDIVANDEKGAQLARARYGALMTVTQDIRSLACVSKVLDG